MKLIYWLSFYLAYFLYFCPSTQAQQFLYDHFGTQQGLPSSNIYRILVDSSEAWIGTGDGLVHFNGSYFSSYPFFSDSIYDNAVLAMCKAPHSDDLMISFYWNGLYKFNTSSQQLTRVASSSLIAGKLTHLQYTSDETLWGLSVNQDLVKLVQDSLILPFPEQQVNAIKAIGNTLWVATSKGIYTIDSSSGQPKLLRSTAGQNIKDFNIKTEKEAVFLTDKRLIHCYADSCHKYHLPVAEAPPNQFEIDQTGNYWIVLKNGNLVLWRPGDSSYSNIHRKPETGLITKIQQDDFGHIWALTEGSGLFRFQEIGAIQLFPFSNVNVLSVDSIDQLWGGGFGNLFCINRGGITEMTLPSQTSKEQIKWIGNGPKGWMVASGKHFWHQQSNSKEWSVFSKSHGALSMEKGLDNDWLIGDFNGLFKLNKRTNFPGDYIKFPYNRVNSFVNDGKGTLWVGSIGQLFKVQQSDTLLHPISKLLKGKSINKLLVHDDTLWVATTGGLFFIYHQHIKHYDLNDGLPHPNCRNIAIDNQERIWVATEGGLTYRLGKTFIPFPLNNNRITDKPTSLTIEHGDKLWVAYPEYLARIELSKVELLPDFPPFQIIHSNNGKVSFAPKATYSFDDIPFDIRLEILPTGLSHFKNLTAQYRLIGLDSVWKDLPSRIFELNSLLPGEYVFQARMKHLHHKTSSVPINFKLTITPVYYQTKWFLLLSVLGIGVFIFLFVWFYIQRVKKQAEQKLKDEQQLHQLKHLALTHSLHPHYLTNSLQSLQQFLKDNSPEKGTLYLKAFAKLIRLNLEDAQYPFLSVEQEIERLELYLQLEKWRLGHQLQYSIILDPLIDDPSEYIIPGMVIQPIVENALWHGIKPKKNGGIIEVSFHLLTENKIQIKIKDNGIGIPEKANKEALDHVSLGTHLIKEKLEWSKLQYSIRFENKRDQNNQICGALVTLELECKLPELPLPQS